MISKKKYTIYCTQNFCLVHSFHSNLRSVARFDPSLTYLWVIRKRFTNTDNRTQGSTDDECLQSVWRDLGKFCRLGKKFGSILQYSLRVLLFSIWQNFEHTFWQLWAFSIVVNYKILNIQCRHLVTLLTPYAHFWPKKANRSRVEINFHFTRLLVKPTSPLFQPGAWHSARRPDAVRQDHRGRRWLVQHLLLGDRSRKARTQVC